ncbi:MAG: hypothetical protein MRZ17_02955 [Acholeplasmataceae bacterium]|nr:hypothetical protein [Acholeplasmataceae bacterium]
MKKSVILLVSAVYIFAIVIVGFLGLKMRVYDPTIYVEKIVCETKGYHEYSEEDKIKKDHDGYIQVEYAKDLVVEINCKPNPDNATNKSFDYSILGNTNRYELTIKNDGTASIKFKEATAYTIIVTATDNHKATLRIKVIVVDSGGIF